MIPLKKEKYKKAGLTKLAGITGSVKKFDKKLHTKYDIEARDLLKNILGENIMDNDDIYGEDMIFTIKNNPHPTKKFPFKYLEVQVFSQWSEETFPYLFPFVYARKMRFSPNTLFVTFNKFLSEVIIFSRNSICENPSRLKKYDRECVHYVVWNKVMRLKSNELTIKNIWLYCGENLDDIVDNVSDNSENNNNDTNTNQSCISVIDNTIHNTIDNTIDNKTTI